MTHNYTVWLADHGRSMKLGLFSDHEDAQELAECFSNFLHLAVYEEESTSALKTILGSHPQHHHPPVPYAPRSTKLSGSFLPSRSLPGSGSLSSPSSEVVFPTHISCPSCGSFPLVHFPGYVDCAFCDQEFHVDVHGRISTGISDCGDSSDGTEFPEHSDLSGINHEDHVKKVRSFGTKICPKCLTDIPIISKERPIKLTCHGCETCFMLRSK